MLKDPTFHTPYMIADVRFIEDLKHFGAAKKKKSFNLVQFIQWWCSLAGKGEDVVHEQHAAVWHTIEPPYP